MSRMIALYPLKVGALALLVWLLVRERLPQTTAIIVAVVLAILIHIAIASLSTSHDRLADARLLKSSLRGELPRDGGRIAVAGTIEAEGQLLRTPFTDKACLLYSYEVYRMVGPSSARASDSSTASPAKVTDYSGVALTDAVIRTSNGRFALWGFPYLTGAVHESGSGATRLTRARDYIAGSQFERTLPLAGEVTAFDRATTSVARSMRFDWQMTDGEKIADATFEEEYVPAGARTCAVGLYSAAKKGLVPGEGAEQRIRLIAGEGTEVLRDLQAGARYSRTIALIMLLVVAAALSYIFVR